MENKKSFVLYCDLIHTVERLSDEQAGDLFKHILRYVNDLNPQTDNFITQLAFEPVKQQLKRDLVQWLSFVEKQKENGKKGGRPKKSEIISHTGKIVPQITDKHFIYFLYDNVEDEYKIGETQNLKQRLYDIKRPTNNLEVVDFQLGDSKWCKDLEVEILNQYKQFKISGDWFKMDKSIATQVVNYISQKTQRFISNPKKAVNVNDNDYSKNNHYTLELTKGIVKGNQPIESLGSVETSGVSIDTQSPQGFLPQGYVDITDDVASKGYKKFLESFPPNKRRHSDEAYQIWESLTQGEKQQLFKHLKSHISKLKTEGKEQFLKNSEKYLESGEWKNIPLKSGSKPGQSISKGGLTTTLTFGSYNFYNWYSKEVNLPTNESFDSWRRHFQNQSAENQTNYQEEFRKFEEHRLNLITQNR